MNAGRDVERLIADWFVEEAVLRAPDRVIEGAGRVIDRTNQRRLGAAWRAIFMSAPLRVAAAAVIGALAIGGALFFLGRAGDTNVGGPGASASPSVSPTASGPASIAAASSSSGPTALRDGPLPAGTYVSAPFAPGEVAGACMAPPQPGCDESAGASIRVVFTIPDGWAGNVASGVWLASEAASPPGGASMGFGRGSWLHSQPCLTQALIAADGAPPDVPVGPSVDDFADALAQHPLLDVTNPVAVTLGGYSGKYVDLQLPSDLTGCETNYRPWEPGIYAQGPSHRWHLWILDVDGVRLVVQATDYAGTSAQHQAELAAIVDSIQIEP
jgi:hypothetical protein